MRTGRWLVVLAFVGTGLAFLARVQFVAVRVEGASMEPTLRTGDRVLVRRVPPHRVRRGQIVVVTNPNVLDRSPFMIKRVVAVAGDRVPRARVPALRTTRQDRVPAGSLVLLGDNPMASYDSRQAGYFSAGTVLGVVVRGPHPTQ